MAEPCANDRDGRARRERGLKLIDGKCVICPMRRLVCVIVDRDEWKGRVGCIPRSLTLSRGVGKLSSRREEVDAIDKAHASLPLLILGHLPLADCRMKNMAGSKAAGLTDDQKRPIDAIICMATGQFTHISRSFTDGS
jgi:hypothetical protein